MTVLFEAPTEHVGILSHPHVPGTEDYDGYYCIKFGSPIKCKCGFNMNYVEVDTSHVVVVWEEKDDEHLLRIAEAFKIDRYDPRIVEYQPDCGKAHEFYSAISKGLIDYDVDTTADS